jgi:hypothetical protein
MSDEQRAQAKTQAQSDELPPLPAGMDEEAIKACMVTFAISKASGYNPETDYHE